MPNNESTDTKIAVVTGGSSGIGRHAAIRLAERGVGVILTYNANREGADETGATVNGATGDGADEDEFDPTDHYLPPRLAPLPPSHPVSWRDFR